MRSPRTRPPRPSRTRNSLSTTASVCNLNPTSRGRVDLRSADPMAVVNARLQVRGVAGLRVVAAGVRPTITSGNTNSPTLMIAERAAQWIAEAHL